MSVGGSSATELAGFVDEAHTAVQGGWGLGEEEEGIGDGLRGGRELHGDCGSVCS